MVTALPSGSGRFLLMGPRRCRACWAQRAARSLNSRADMFSSPPPLLPIMTRCAALKIRLPGPALASSQPTDPSRYVYPRLAVRRRLADPPPDALVERRLQRHRRCSKAGRPCAPTNAPRWTWPPAAKAGFARCTCAGTASRGCCAAAWPRAVHCRATACTWMNWAAAPWASCCSAITPSTRRAIEVCHYPQQWLPNEVQSPELWGRRSRFDRGT